MIANATPSIRNPGPFPSVTTPLCYAGQRALKRRRSARDAMQIDPRLSPVPALQQLRTLHPGALQHLQQSPDGSIYPHHQTVPQPVYPQPQYALSGPPHPPLHAIPYQHHGLPGPLQPAQYSPYPATYQHVSSPRFSGAQQLQSPPQPVQQQLPLPAPPPPRSAPQQVTVQAFPGQIQQHAHVDNLAPQLGLEAEDAPPASHSSHFQGLKMIAEPPDLDAWRQRLFDVDEAITLSEQEYACHCTTVLGCQEC